MKKILLCLCLLAGYGMAQDNVNSTSRDKSGFFLGFELGMTELNGKTSAAGYNAYNISVNTPMYGFRAGYKGFFNDYVGLAGYVSFKDSLNTGELSGLGTAYKGNLHFMPIMANIDLLYDFYNTQNVSLGAFIGIGLGGAIFTYNGTMPDLITNTNLVSGNKITTGGFYSDVKVGLSSSFDNHQISLIASFPFAPMEDNVSIADVSIKQNYAISLAYDYKF